MHDQISHIIETSICLICLKNSFISMKEFYLSTTFSHNSFSLATVQGKTFLFYRAGNPALLEALQYKLKKSLPKHSTGASKNKA